MYPRVALALVVAGAMLAATALVGCSSGSGSQPDVTPPDELPTEAPAQPGDGTDPAAGMRLAAGLYDLDDGTVQGLGTLEYQDLEGGFWALVGAPESEGGSGVIAVIANSAELDAELKALEGKTVMITGKKLDGVSVRMAGPEVEVTSFEEVSDTPGIAE